ncbi:MAG: hypothetical protein ACLVJ6_13820 [Merdibacter sp.]
MCQGEFHLNSQILFDYDKSEAEPSSRRWSTSMCFREKGWSPITSLTVGYSDKSRKHAHASQALHHTGLAGR